jgi:hypothetical protein
VLDIVNALRFASTRPTAGPSGIDDASARHGSGSCAMVATLSIARVMLTRESPRAYVGLITLVPHGTPSVRRHGQRSAHSAGAPWHGIERKSHTSQPESPTAESVCRHVHELRTS